MLTAEPATTDADSDGITHTTLTWRIVVRVTVIYAAARVAVVFIAQAASWLSNGKQTVYGAFTKWDSAWYAYIAEKGYPDNLSNDGGNRWAFFPGWPLLMRVVHVVVGGTWQRNGIALAVVLGFVSAVLIYLTIADALGEEVAYRTTMLMCFAPTAALLSMVYSEVLFIPCCAACLLFLGRRHWALAG